MSHTFTDDLKQTLATNPRDLVVVVGAGVTIGALRGSPLAKLASWRGLLTSGLDHLGATHTMAAADVERVRGLLDSTDTNLWIDAAQMITRRLGGKDGGEMKAWLRATVGAFAANVREHEVLAALRALGERGALLSTVNYDGVLEAATGSPPVTWRDPAKVQRVLRGEDRGILHFHGYWEDPGSVVFGARSYDEVVADEHTRTFLKSLGVDRTFLFVGHGAGLQDPNWGSFLRWAEVVLSGLEHRHYRLVREDERERVQAEHPQGQRIFALAYGATHDQLGPFLRSLSPATTVPTAVTATEASTPATTPPVPVRTIVLRLNIGDRGHHWLSEDEARDLVDAPNLTMLSIEHVLDRQATTARQWRALAQKIDATLALARKDITVRTPVQFVIVGQAPLPVFAHLGHQMRRDRGPITVINHRHGDIWDRIGAPQPGPAAGDDPFEVKKPDLGRIRRGKIVLSIQCSKEYSYTEDMVEPMLLAEGASLLCSYQIHHRYSHKHVWMTQKDLTLLLGHVEDALTWIKDKCPDSDGLVVALGGPGWVAFWVANRLNANVRGRIDYPNRIPGQGYVRALASPMHLAPWFTGRAKLMIMAAEPDNQGSTRAGRAIDAIQEALERELGSDGPYELRTRGATKVADIMREVDLFRPDILHLHLHGSPSGELAFEDERGEAKTIKGKDFVAMLAATGIKPTLIVLSACHLAVLTPELLEIAECVVAMTSVMPFKVTITFSAGFYAALGRGHTLKRAVEQGKQLTRGQHGSGDEKIELTSAQEMDPDQIILFLKGDKAPR